MATTAPSSHRLKPAWTIAALPKVELHLHLEGAVRPSTLADIARTVEPGDRVAAWLSDPDGTHITSFDELMVMLAQINDLLLEPETYERVALEALSDLAAQNVVYAELRMNPYRPLKRGLSLDELVQAIHSAQASAEEAFGIESGLIIGLNRNRGPEAAAELVQQATHLPYGSVAGFDLSDREAGWPPRLFRAVFESIRDAGFPVTVHAGELAGPESVADAIGILGARRIGHALSGAEDPDVLRYIAARSVHLELCPGSNRRLGLIRTLREHPLRAFDEAGISISLNSDDPAIFGWTLTDELTRAMAAFDLDLDDIVRLMRNAAEHSFAPDAQRARILRRLGPDSSAARNDRRDGVGVRLGADSAGSASGDSQKRLDSLLRVTRAVTSEIEIDRVLRVVAEETSRALDAERTTMFVADHDTGTLWSRVAEGLRTREIELPLGQGLAGAVASTGELLNVPDVYADPRFDPSWDAKTGYRTHSMLMHPALDLDGQVIGVVQVINKHSGTFDRSDEEMLAGIAAAASTALRNAQHFAEMRRLIESALETMAAMLDARDPHTAGHTRRVADAAQILGRRLNLNAQQLAELRIAATVHDYGKLSVPDAILNKPGSLTDEEWTIVRDHVHVTRRILQNFAFPPQLSDVPRIACEHHERFDGSGYPDGLRGDAACIEGRVLAVADVLDAMSTKRPYRDALSIEETMAFLIDNRGVLFDPAVIDALVESRAELARLRV